MRTVGEEMKEKRIAGAWEPTSYLLAAVAWGSAFAELRT